MDWVPKTTARFNPSVTCSNFSVSCSPTGKFLKTAPFESLSEVTMSELLRLARRLVLSVFWMNLWSARALRQASLPLQDR